MATFPSKVNYATGDILTATNMNDVGGAINLLEGAQFAAGKNKIINGDFGVWQRGTSFSTKNTYNADRYYWTADGTGDTNTISRQTFTPGTAPVAGYEGQYFFRYARTVAPTGQLYNDVRQYIESVTTFAGQTVTLSFWAKADSARTLSSYFTQYFGSGGSPSASVYTSGTNFSVTTAWQRFTFTVAIPSISGKTLGTAGNDFLGVYFNFPLSGTFTMDIWGVQVEAASTASNFQTATGTKQGELAACQRYYYRTSTVGLYGFYGVGLGTGTTSGTTQVKLAQTMRVVPTSLDSTTIGNYRFWNSTTSTATTAVGIDTATSTTDLCGLNFNVAAGLVGGSFYMLTSNNNASTYLGFSAEL